MLSGSVLEALQGFPNTGERLESHWAWRRGMYLGFGQHRGMTRHLATDDSNSLCVCIYTQSRYESNMLFPNCTSRFPFQACPRNATNRSISCCSTTRRFQHCLATVTYISHQEFVFPNCFYPLRHAPPSPSGPFRTSSNSIYMPIFSLFFMTWLYRS